MTSRSTSTPSNPSPTAPPLTALTHDAQRQQIEQWFHACRKSTLALFEGMDYATFSSQPHPDFSPVGWHLGHIAYTEALWLLQRSAHRSPQFPQYHQLFAQDGLPKGDRCQLPPLPTVYAYLEAVRADVMAYLQICPIVEQERLWRWLLQHESQHCETITLVLAMQARQFANRTVSATGNANHYGAEPTGAIADRPPLPAMICIPAGPCHQGYGGLDALDNERPVHSVELATYWIDRTPVTCAQYRAFMQAGGYHTAAWWSPAGWQWVRSEGVSQPFYWQADPAYADHPVCGVSYYEAEAYANFVGKRLPTEAEWEKAASGAAEPSHQLIYPWGNDWPTAEHCNHGHCYGTTTPVDRFPQGNSPTGCADLLGNVWEWTSSWFAPYPHFTPYPYPGYSQTYFDGAHRVLRGGSWATRPWALRNAFRNWYHPQMRQMLAGFRCASDVAL
jgi:gamma-glutamyl hercynylcysteine S-oxide synthase